MGASVPVALLASVSLAVITAAPWLRQELVVCAIGSVVAGLLLARHVRGWVGESAALLTAILSLSIAFHWAPKVLAHAMDTSDRIGLAFTVPIVLWDALRLVAPFWFVARLVRDPRDAWLPAALVAVVTEAVLPSVFPWKLGYTLIAWPVTIQGVDAFGPEWSTFVLFAIAGAVIGVLAAILIRAGRGQLVGIDVDSAGRAWTPTGLAALAVVAGSLVHGMWAMASWSAAIAAAPKLRVALVQADPSEEDAIEVIAALTQLYREQGRYLERMYKWLKRVGMESIQASIVRDLEKRRFYYDRFVFSQKFAQVDPWEERVNGKDAHEFAALAEFGVPQAAE